MKATYVAEATCKGGRKGHVRSSDGLLDLDLALPEALGGPGGAPNPEMLFAAAYAACYGSAIELFAGKRDIDTTEATVTAEVGLDADDGFKLLVELHVHIPGTDRETAQKIADRAHEVCPYSVATRGNIDVAITIVD